MAERELQTKTEQMKLPYFLSFSLAVQTCQLILQVGIKSGKPLQARRSYDRW